MELTKEVRTLLAVVRQELSTRTDWILQGQDLMAEHAALTNDLVSRLLADGDETSVATPTCVQIN